jgi:hypothetical protein
MEPMMRASVIIVLLVGCSGGSSTPDAPDSPPGAAPTVMVKSPNGGESFYPGSAVQVQWSATGSTALHADITAFDGTATTTIATGVSATSGMTVTTPWSVGTLAQKDTYRIQVTVTDDVGDSAMDSSDADFSIKAAQAVSFSGQVQPIFTTSCTSTQCHDANVPQAMLDLTTGASYAELVGMPSKQCTSVKLVAANDPDQSYLVWD